MPVFSCSSLKSCGWKRERVWDIWCSESGQDSALQGSSVSRSISWHGFEGSGCECVCVRGPPDAQTERRALFSQVFVSVQIRSTLQTLLPSHCVFLRRSENFERAEKKTQGKCSSWHCTPKDWQYSFDNVIKYPWLHAEIVDQIYWSAFNISKNRFLVQNHWNGSDLPCVILTCFAMTEMAQIRWQRLFEICRWHCEWPPFSLVKIRA